MNGTTPPPRRPLVVLAEDQRLLREAVERILRRSPALNFVGASENLAGLVDLVSRRRPDVALVDLYMPEGVPDGFVAAAQLPRIHPPIRMLALSSSTATHDVRRAFNAGFHGYSTKEVGPELLVRRVELVAAGHHFVDREIARALRDDSAVASFEERHLAILQGYAGGLTRAEVATSIHVGDRQLRRLERRLCGYLDARTMPHAVALAVAMGLVHARGSATHIDDGRPPADRGEGE